MRKPKPIYYNLSFAFMAGWDFQDVAERMQPLWRIGLPPDERMVYAVTSWSDIPRDVREKLLDACARDEAAQ